jgi:hypothetical protein
VPSERHPRVPDTFPSRRTAVPQCGGPREPFPDRNRICVRCLRFVPGDSHRLPARRAVQKSRHHLRHHSPPVARGPRPASAGRRRLHVRDTSAESWRSGDDRRHLTRAARPRRNRLARDGRPNSGRGGSVPISRNSLGSLSRTRRGRGQPAGLSARSPNVSRRPLRSWMTALCSARHSTAGTPTWLRRPRQASSWPRRWPPGGRQKFRTLALPVVRAAPNPAVRRPDAPVPARPARWTSPRPSPPRG